MPLIDALKTFLYFNTLQWKRNNEWAQIFRNDMVIE